MAIVRWFLSSHIRIYLWGIGSEKSYVLTMAPDV